MIGDSDNNFLPYITVVTELGKLKFLVDTGSNKNYIDPSVLNSNSVLQPKPITVRNIDKTHNIESFTELQILSKIPPIKFFVFKFHNYFDGLIGYETLKSLKANIITERNILELQGLTIPLNRKYPDSFAVKLKPYEETVLRMPTVADEGEFLVEEAIPVTKDAIVLPGLYRAFNNFCYVLLKNIRDFPVQICPSHPIPNSIHNFEISNIPPDICETKTGPKAKTIKQLKFDHLNDEEKAALIAIISKFHKIFHTEGDDLTFTNVIKHKINTTDEIPTHAKNYRYPHCHKEEVQRQISQMLTQGIIRPSSSPWCSPIWIVPKKIDSEGKQKWRLVVDYRKLNEKTIDDKYPMPNINEILDKLGKCQYFTTLDLASGFHQIEVHPDDVQKTAFSVEYGLYEYVRMPFGLKNAPATLQRVMNNILRNLIGKCCLVYMDDIIVYSTSLQEHLENLTKIFSILENVNLKIQLGKSQFMKKQVNFLGHLVTDEGVKPDPEKIKVIQNWPTPRNPKELKGFLGLLGYYRKFIRDFAKITKPLTAQLRKGEKIKHTPIFLKTIDTCKQLITSSDVLQYPDFSKNFILTTDASNFALGAVLSQGAIGKDRPVAFASRTLTKSEEKYSAIEKELLAIDWATKYFRPYLFGRKFTLYTDHQPLTYALNLKTPNSKLVQWMLRLREYDFVPVYRPGQQNVVADALSRVLTEVNINEEEPEERDSQPEIQNNDLIEITESPVNTFNNQIILKMHDTSSEAFEEVFPRVYRKTISKSGFDSRSLKKIFYDNMVHTKVNCIYCPEELIPAIQEVYRQYFSQLNPFRIKISLKFLIDLKTDEEQNAIVEETHETAHRGILENKAEIFRRFYFPNLKQKIKKYVNLCETCNKQKYERKPYKIRLGETPIPKKPLEIIHVDIFIIQPNLFLSVVDKFSRFGTLIPIKSRSIPHVRKAFIKYFSLYGNPALIVSDNEPAIKSIEVRGLLADLGIQQYFTPSNHSQVNGIVERFHSTLLEIFRTNKHKFDDLSLKEKILISCTLYNNTIHTSTSLKPREIFYGIIDGSERPLNMDEIIEYRNKLYDGVTEKISKIQKQQHDYHNAKRENEPSLDIGGVVFNTTQGIKSKSRNRFEPVVVIDNNNQTYVDEKNRTLHKQKLRRLKK